MADDGAPGDFEIVGQHDEHVTNKMPIS
jgi:hypothetical protein